MEENKQEQNKQEQNKQEENKQEEEKKLDVKAQKTQILKELSKEWNINFFEPKEVKSKLEELNKWQESQKSEQEKLQEQLGTYETKVKELENQTVKYQATIEAFKLNIDPDKVDKAMKLADNDVSKLPDVIKEFPSFIKAQANGNPAVVTLKTKEQQQQGENVPPVLAAFRASRK